jgi:hypothetical protein
VRKVGKSIVRKLDNLGSKALDPEANEGFCHLADFLVLTDSC